MKVFLLFIAIVLTGCETMPTTAAAPAKKSHLFDPAPGHETATNDDFMRDKWTCLRDTQSTPVYFDSCMGAHGWIRETN